MQHASRRYLHLPQAAPAIPPPPRLHAQNATNPAIIPRNHVMVGIIAEAEVGNYSQLHRCGCKRFPRLGWHAPPCWRGRGAVQMQAPRSCWAWAAGSWHTACAARHEACHVAVPLPVLLPVRACAHASLTLLRGACQRCAGFSPLFPLGRTSLNWLPALLQLHGSTAQALQQRGPGPGLAGAGAQAVPPGSRAAVLQLLTGFSIAGCCSLRACQANPPAPLAHPWMPLPGLHNAHPFRVFRILVPRNFFSSVPM